MVPPEGFLPHNVRIQHLSLSTPRLDVKTFELCEPYTHKHVVLVGPDLILLLYANATSNRLLTKIVVQRSDRTVDILSIRGSRTSSASLSALPVNPFRSPREQMIPQHILAC
jgi:hypothetical protein